MSVSAEYVDVRGVSILTGVPVATLNTMRVRGGGPPFIKVSHRVVRYSVQDVRDWMRSRLRISTSDAGDLRAPSAA